MLCLLLALIYFLSLWPTFLFLLINMFCLMDLLFYNFCAMPDFLLLGLQTIILIETFYPIKKCI